MTATEQTLVIAIHSFETVEPNELAFVKGEIINVLKKDESGWWKGRFRFLRQILKMGKPKQNPLWLYNSGKFVFCDNR